MTALETKEISTEHEQRNALIGQQNDRFRGTWGADFKIPGSIVTTRGVAELSVAWQAKIMSTVMQFSKFEDGDAQHCFGAFDVTVGEETRSFFWAITLYDNDCEGGSPKPEDPTQTHRVLTIMFPSEY